MKNDSKPPIKKIIKATHIGKLTLGDISIPCSVLENGKRVFTRLGISQAFTGTRAGGFSKKDSAPDMDKLPRFLTRNYIFPHIPKELLLRLSSPIEYQPLTGGTTIGFEAELLPEICALIIDINKKIPLPEKFVHVAETLLKSFALVGIIALVDEATGFQLIRGSDALRLLLARFIDENMRPWVKLFPDSFFESLDRLYGHHRQKSKNRPQYYGGIINKYIYDPIENGYFKAELDKLNIKDDGTRKARFHQWLKDEGRIAVALQIGRVESMMALFDDKDKFNQAMKKMKNVSIAPYLFDEWNKIIE